ncbi:MAG: glutamate--tRNA ligase [Fervidicoccaceae archaeon]
MEEGDGLERIALKHALINAIKHEGKAQTGAVVSKVLGEKPELKTRAREVVEIVSRAVEKVNSMSRQQQEEMLRSEFPEIKLEQEKKEEAKRLPPLPDVDKFERITTRFAPNPDFVIHLGNARPAILSYEYARMYNGKFILRFEDTDPRIKTPMVDAYRQIREDLIWLGVKWDEEYIQSLRLPIYYKIAKELIMRGGGFVDDTTKENYEEMLSKGEIHPNRDKPPEHNLELFERMLSGYYKEGEAVLRVKTDLSYSDKSLIDWVAFRIINTERYPHPIVGSKYIVWPTYNFASAVDDYLMGVTHIIRGKEHLQNTMKQKHLFDHLGWRQPVAIHLGRLRLEEFIMSKSQIKKILKESGGAYSGPDDPRFGTIMGLRERGIKAEAIRSVIMTVGAKQSDASISFANLASENRKIIDPVSPRLMFVEEPIELIIENREEEDCITTRIPYHPDRAELGSREFTVCSGDRILISKQDYEYALEKRNGELRLMELGNYRIDGGKLVMISKELSYAREKELSIVQWVQKKNAKLATIFDTNKKSNSKSPDYREGAVEDGEKLRNFLGKNVQLVRIGFAVLKSLSPVATFIYTHE